MVLLFSIPTVAAAANDDSGFYLGLGAGEANVDLDTDLGVVDDTSSTFRLYGGYDFNRFVAAEVGYLKVDDFRGELASIEGPVTTRFDLDGFTVGANGRYNFNDNWFAQAQLGLLFWQSDARIDGAIGSFRDRANDTDPYYGLSVGRKVGRNWQVMGQWTRYETDESDLDFVNVALTWHLRNS